MSKQLTALLLKRKIDNLKPEDRRLYLINCLRSNGFIKEETESQIMKTPESVCKLCKSSDLIASNHELVCQKCGAAETRIDVNKFKTFKQDINFTKGTFIEPGQETITVMKDGRPVQRDLATINTWTSSDPEEQRMNDNLKKMNETLDTFEGKYNPVVYDRVRKEILAMWYNVLKFKPSVRGKEKQALAVWSIYYQLVYNNLPINIQKVASLFDIQIGEVYSYNKTMKDIFSGTSFEKYTSIPVGTPNISIPDEMKSKVNRIKRDLKDYLSSPLKDKETHGILYYIAKQMNDKKFTLVYLSEKSGLSTVLISSEANKIDNFYKKNPGLKAKLF